MKQHLIASVLIVVVAIVSFTYFIAQDRPATWLIRASWAGAITAGLGVGLWALAEIITGRRGGP